MKPNLLYRLGWWAVRGLAAFTLLGVARAFPPAPHHEIYGLVRGELGDPLTYTNAEVVLITGTGLQIKTGLIPNLEPGVNYRLLVPMDAGLTADTYKPTALHPTVPFRLLVKIGLATYRPMGLAGDFVNLGQPARRTRLDLTLGEDSDGDGLPDAWERAMLAAAGSSLSLADFKPDDDLDGDGLRNLDEYIAGTYAFDSQDGFTLAIQRPSQGSPYLEFLGLRGRTYTILGSPDLERWTAVGFRLRTDSPAGPVRSYHYAADVRVLQAEVVLPSGPDAPAFFKLLAQ